MTLCPVVHPNPSFVGSKPRILLVYQFFGPYHRARWQQWRNDARAAGFEPMGLGLFRQPDLYAWEGENEVDFHSLDLPTNGRDEVQWLDLLRIHQYLEEVRPAVVIVNGWAKRDAWLLHLWCILRGVPRILVSDSQRRDRVRRGLGDLVKRCLVTGVAAFFAAGSASQRYLRDLGAEANLVFVGNDVVDNDHFRLPRAQVRKDSRKIVLTVARFAPEKNLRAAAAAFVKFLNETGKRGEWVWKVAGYGPQQEMMESAAKESAGAIELLGAVDYEDLPKVFAGADLYWQPSIKDTWGLPINEAMAAGLPVLVSDRCGCGEDLVADENGWVFDPFTVEGIKEGLERAAADENRWPTMGEASRHIISRWGLARFSEELLQAVAIAVR